TAAPLYDLLKGESKRSVKTIKMDNKCQIAFSTLRGHLSEKTLRYKPDFSKPFILTTDASEHGIGAILSQTGSDGKDKFVSAYSKSLEKAHKNYSTTDKELLAVVKSISHYRNYLLGKEFILKTDHKALTYMWETKNPTSRLLRWAMILQEFSFIPTYIKGEENGADGFSRQPIVAQLGERRVDELTLEDKQKIIESYHLLSGHGKPNTMKFMINQRYKWKTLHKDVEEYVKKCEICLKSGYPLINTKNRVIKTERPNQLWELDLIGRIPDKSGGNSFIFIAIDHYSKWVETAIINHKTGPVITEAIQKLIIDKHGIPTIILTDNGL
ncbi:MAG: RNase H-like domain-containing protein, partial [Clostridium sp.]|uniref:RNase H-like domain-containing protein n=1 Tax=Clostridium sp. TaxID=1506 RepID=UPI003F35BC20